MEHYVCSVCGQSCGQDARMGSIDRYLTCDCARDMIWINDGRGGYMACRNGAEIITWTEYTSRQKR